MTRYRIPFNKPYLSGKELLYMEMAIKSGKLSGNGDFTQKCQTFFQLNYHMNKVLMTSSCTDALEMAAILTKIGPGDEVIMPSFTFVSTANAFVLRGAKVVFIDSREDHPGIDESQIEECITPRTKVIVPVHYAGIACEMDIILSIAKRHNLFVVEDAAQAIDSYYTDSAGKAYPLGTLGHLSAFSFHETKNVISGEGGMLVVNADEFSERAEIIWEKGTNRSAFFRGEIDKYGWVDLGSSFLPSEITTAFLYAQLEELRRIQDRRKAIWELYNRGLSFWADKSGVRLAVLPDWATNNAHMFYLVCRDRFHRERILNQLKSKGILAVFHYQSLHASPFFRPYHDGRELKCSDLYSDCLLRLPLFFELSDTVVLEIVDIVKSVDV